MARRRPRPALLPKAVGSWKEAEYKDHVSDARIPFRTVFLYSLPCMAVNYTFMLSAIYLLKYSTDVLLVGPGAMGFLFGASRIWDAVSDPIAGHLSDRTRSLALALKCR